MRARGLAVLSAVLLVTSANAQTVLQSGNVTAGHTTSWAGSGVVRDAGTSDTPNIVTQGILANGGTPFCIDTALDPNPRLKFCLAVQNGSAATMSLYSYNGAAMVPFQLNVNGTIYPFPSVNPGFGAFRTVSSGSTDLATSLDGFIAWNSATTAGKTETLYACSAGAKGSALIVADEIGTAATYPVTLTPNGVDTINGTSSYTMGSTHQAVQITCNGAGNWVVSTFPFSGTPTSNLRVIASGSTDTATALDSTIAWDSSTASAKAQTLFACSSSVRGQIVTVKDEIGTAGTYAITVTPASGTIDGGSNYALSFNYQAITLQCDGGSNWMTL